MIRVEVTDTLLLNVGTDFVVLLKSTADQRALPISIGTLEAQSIAIKLGGKSFPRPLTHDLFRNTLQTLGCPLVRVVVCDLVDDTFYAKIVVDDHGTEREIDSRPSDAISLALRFGAPMFVEETVMDQAGVVFPPEESKKRPAKPAEAAPKGVSLEALQKQLDQAVAAERYEDAARLRDEIKRLGAHN